MAFAMREIKIDEEVIHKGYVGTDEIEKGFVLLGVSGVEDEL